MRRRLKTAGGAIAAEPGIALMVMAAAVVYGVYAVVRYDHFETGFDLGIFTQAIWHASRLETPGSTIKGIGNLFGDHFHPIILLLAPAMRLWSDPRTLLIGQAVLVAASIVPVFLFARSRLGRTGAYLLAFTYATFWGLASGTGYEFHEVAFAPLLIALTLLFADRERWTAYFVCLALVLCVKEDLSLLVCFFGIYLLTKGERRRGLITLAAGVAWYLLATRVFIPHFADAGRGFTYWSYPDFGDNLGDAALHVLRNPLKPFDVAFDRPQKVHTLLYLFLPFLGLTLFSREALLAIPLLAERFLSAMPAFWGTSFHYSLAIAPILAMGASAGLANVAGLAAPALRGRLKLAGAGAMLAAGMAVTWFAVPGAPIHRMVHAEFWRAPPYTAGIEGALTHLPPGPVLAPDALVARVATRPRSYELARQSGNVQYIVAPLITPVGSNSPDGRATFRQLENNVLIRLLFYEPIYYRDGWVVLRLRPNGANSGGNGVLRPLPRPTAERIGALEREWKGTFGTINRRLSACGPLVGRHPQAAAACFTAIGPDLEAVQAQLDPELARTLRQATGGCRQLGELARFGAAQTTRDVAELRTSGASPRSRRFDRAVRAYTADVNDFDLPGRLTRFVVLCYPRPLIVAPARGAK